MKHDVTNVMENGYHIVNKQKMSKRSIRKVIARARRNSYTALKFHIKGLMWVDDVTVDTHLKIFSDDYMKYFWSHLATSCTILRSLSEDDICATPNSICELITPNSTIEPFAGSVRVRMPQSAFYLKEYGDRISCGPEYPGNTVLHAKAADIAQLIVAYDKEVSRCNAVVTKAINECRREEVAIKIASASAEAVAGAILRKENMQIDAVQVGTHRVKYSVMTVNQIHDVDFWASTEEFKPRLLRAIRRLRHKERLW